MQVWSGIRGCQRQHTNIQVGRLHQKLSGTVWCRFIWKIENTCKSCDIDINFFLMWQKGVYLYECLDIWQRFSKGHCWTRKLFKSFILHNFCQRQDWHGKHAWKRQVILKLLADVDMLLMVEKDVGDGMCQCVMAYIDTLNH